MKEPVGRAQEHQTELSLLRFIFIPLLHPPNFVNRYISEYINWHHVSKTFKAMKNSSKYYTHRSLANKLLALIPNS